MNSFNSSDSVAKLPFFRRGHLLGFDARENGVVVNDGVDVGKNVVVVVGGAVAVDEDPTPTQTS